MNKEKEIDLKSIIKGCKGGRGSAQKLLFEKYYGYAKRICLRYTSNVHQAEDMVTDSFLKVFANVKSFDENGNFMAWLKTITVRTCIDHYRKYGQKVAFVDVEDVPYIEDSTGDALDTLGVEEIMELVQKLPPSYRTVFSLYVIDGYSHAEIAAMLQVNEGTCRSNLAKARLKLQQWIKNYASEKIMKY